MPRQSCHSRSNGSFACQVQHPLDAALHLTFHPLCRPGAGFSRSRRTGGGLPGRLYRPRVSGWVGRTVGWIVRHRGAGAHGGGTARARRRPVSGLACLHMPNGPVPSPKSAQVSQKYAGVVSELLYHTLHSIECRYRAQHQEVAPSEGFNRLIAAAMLCAAVA